MQTPLQKMRRFLMQEQIHYIFIAINDGLLVHICLINTPIHIRHNVVLIYSSNYLFVQNKAATTMVQV